MQAACGVPSGPCCARTRHAARCPRHLPQLLSPWAPRWKGFFQHLGHEGERPPRVGLTRTPARSAAPAPRSVPRPSWASVSQGPLAHERGEMSAGARRSRPAGRSPRAFQRVPGRVLLRLPPANRARVPVTCPSVRENVSPSLLRICISRVSQGCEALRACAHAHVKKIPTRLYSRKACGVGGRRSLPNLISCEMMEPQRDPRR